MNKLILTIYTAFLLVFSTHTVADDGGCKTLIFKELNALPHKVESYPFRVWYATEGKNALKTPTADPAGNGMPVVINDLLLQLHSADTYYSQNMGLTPPLLQQRYKQAEFIDVYLVAMEKGNGLAFDEVIANKSSREAERHSCGIKMQINSALQPSRNVTPAHELFHLYQYANSMFKARWYLEGMARWVEQAFRGVSPRDAKAVAPNSCTEVYDESYTASRYWQDLASRQQAADIVIGPDDIKLTYSDARPVFKDHAFKNGAAVKNIFNSLNTASLEVSKEVGLPPYKWPEKTQRSAKFNTEICEAAENSMF